MTESFHLKTGDTAPRLTAVLRDNTGEPVDLDAASVRFQLREPRGGDELLDDAASITDPSNGEVEYVWDDGDTDTSGRYRAQFTVDYPDDSVETFPNDGFHDVIISE